MSRGFLERWSRLKQSANAAPAATTTASNGAGATEPAEAAPIDPEKLLAELHADSDFSTFLREEVSEAIRRQAMKKLFADPHFNVMDGLDIYIDDYSISDPIPPEMLATLNQARNLLFDTPETDAAASDTGTPAQGAADILPDAACDNLTRDGQNVALSETASASTISGADQAPAMPNANDAKPNP